MRRAREASVGHERDGIAEPGALQRTRHVEHLAHPRPALGTFPADDDHIVGLDLLRLDRLEGVLFAIEDPSRTPVEILLLPGDLGDASLGREVTLQYGQAAFLLQRVVERADHLLARRLLCRARLFTDRPSGPRRLVG